MLPPLGFGSKAQGPQAPPVSVVSEETTRFPKVDSKYRKLYSYVSWSLKTNCVNLTMYSCFMLQDVPVCFLGQKNGSDTP